MARYAAPPALPFDAIFAHALDACFVLDDAGRVVSWNPAASELFGFPAEAALGKPLIELIFASVAPNPSPADPAGTAQPLSGPADRTVRLVNAVHQDGGALMIELAESAVEVAHRQFVIGYARGVSDGVMTQQLLEENEMLLAKAQKISGLGVWLLDFECTSLAPIGTSWSDELYALLELDRRRTMPGMAAYLEQVHPHDRLYVSMYHRDAAATIDAWEISYRLLMPDGRIKFVTEVSQIVSTEDLDRQRRQGTVAEITARTHMERQLAKRGALQEADQRLALQMQAIGNLSSSLGHDFNNLLSILEGNLRFMQDMLSDRPDATELFEDAFSAIEDGAAMTRRLLTFSHATPQRPQDLTVSEASESLERVLRRNLPQAVELRLEIQDPDALFCVDPSALEDAMLNLVSNARDAMPTGGTLVLGARAANLSEDNREGYAVPVAGDYVILTLTDSGSCIQPADLPRVFEPFFSTKRGGGRGKGLGLSMVAYFVKASGGACHIASEPGKGTTVSLLFRQTTPAH